MLRSAVGTKQKISARMCPLVVFTVGGRRLAVKTDEVADISEWKESIPVPSRTPFIAAVVRREREVFPVFDLAGLLHVSMQGTHLLCLTVKHPHGTMALCIDEEMPVLHTLDTAAIQVYQGGDFEAVGSFTSGFDEIPIIAVSKLASA
jgi:chemotaxis signal transduction protein